MTTPYEQIGNAFDIDANWERMHTIINAGTSDLWEAALTSAKFLVSDAASAGMFIQEYNELEAYSLAHEGQLPGGVFPRTGTAVLAINALKAARTQNIMANPGLNATYKNDRQAAAKSLFVIGTPVEVAEGVLQKLKSEK